MENIIPVLLGGSWSSGINLYMTTAGLGIAHRMHWLTLPGDMNILGNPLIIGLALAMYGIEFVADKIPFVDHAWDMVHTFIRPAGGAAMGYLATAQAGPAIQTGVAILAGTVALSSHLTKASTRAAINSTTMGAGAPIASVAEDAGVFGILYLIVQHPIIATMVILLLIVISIWILIKLFRFVKRLFRPVKRGEVIAQKV